MRRFLTWLASFRLRVLFRTAFVLLALAVLAGLLWLNERGNYIRMGAAGHMPDISISDSYRYHTPGTGGDTTHGHQGKGKHA